MGTARYSSKTVVIVTMVLGVFVFCHIGWSTQTNDEIRLDATAKKQRKGTETEKLIRNYNYNWLVKGTNVLPNYFTRRVKNSHRRRQTDPQDYANGTIVFVHNQKSGGSTIKYCLKSMMKNANKTKSIGTVTNYNAIEFYKAKEMDGFNKTPASVYVGTLTFGVCRYTTKPCSYFTIMRDPYERLISSYNLCHLSNTPQCQVKNAKEMSVKEWAIYQGSWFFRQITFNPEFFTHKYENRIDELANGDDPIIREIPWWRNYLILNDLMSNEQKDIVLDYILDNLETWFAVVGLTTEAQMNYRLLEQVYNLPFPTECDSVVKNQRSYSKIADATNTTKEDIIKAMRQELLSDDEVNKALHYDVEIYRKLQDIFRRQVLAFEQDSKL